MSQFQSGKACPNCGGRKWVKDTDTVNTPVNGICPICQGTGSQKVPMPNTYSANNQRAFPAMNQSLESLNANGTWSSNEILDDLWDSTPNYISS